MKGCNKTRKYRKKTKHLGGGNNFLKIPSQNISLKNAYPNKGDEIITGEKVTVNPTGIQIGGNNFGGGEEWRSNISTWPGVNGTNYGGNHYPLNTYSQGDPQTAMKDVGANPPYMGGKRRSRRKKRRSSMRGGFSSFFGQDLINLGRQAQFGMGSAYNALAGYNAPVNPLPWKDQMPNLPNISTMRAMYQ